MHYLLIIYYKYTFKQTNRFINIVSHEAGLEIGRRYEEDTLFVTRAEGGGVIDLIINFNTFGQKRHQRVAKHIYIA